MKHDTQTGRFTGPSRSTAERFWEKVSKTPGCWFWIGGCSTLGYGYFWNGTKVVGAHRWAYEDARGPISVGLELDHLCRTPSCIRPDHLEAVPHRTNMQRGETGKPSGIQQLAKAHCPQGHPYDEANTYINPGSGARHCRTCRAEWDRHHKAEATARMRRWRANKLR